MADKLKFDYDRERDILTVEGIRYAGEVFRDLGHLMPVGQSFTVVERQDGVLVLKANG